MSYANTIQPGCSVFIADFDNENLCFRDSCLCFVVVAVVFTGSLLLGKPEP